MTPLESARRSETKSSALETELIEAPARLVAKPVNDAGFGLTPVAAASVTCYAYL